MNPVPRQKLADLVARFGRDISADARRCEALLRDMCGEHHKREVFVLVGAVKDRVAAELAAGLNGIPRDALFAKLSKRLHNNLGLTEDLARWSVESWALALQVIQIEDLALQFYCPDCAHVAKFLPHLAGKRVQCPKCKAVVLVSDDGRRFEVEGKSVAAGPAAAPAASPFDEDDPFAEEASVTPGEMLRQAIRRIVADGVVTEQEKAEVQALRRALCIPPETASRLFVEEKARLSKMAAAGAGNKSTPVPSAVIHHVWVEVDAERDGQDGLLIHAHFTARSLKGLGIRVAACFELANGDRMAGTNPSFSSGGQLSVSQDLSPRHDKSAWRDLTLFLPYEQLPLDQDIVNDCRLFVTVSRIDATNQELARSPYVTFSYGEAPEDAGTSICCPHCLRPFSTEDSDEVQCPHCSGTFNLDEDGDLLGVKIDCPHCNQPIYAEGTEEAQCRHCSGTFNLDDDGDLLGVKIDCPHCNQPTYAEGTDEAQCRHCNGTFNLDDDGNLLGVKIDCPHCGKPVYAEGTEENVCRHCSGVFNLDDDGEPLGAEIDCPHCGKSLYSEETEDIDCPHCRQTFNTDEAGDDPESVGCPHCGKTFFTNHTGGVKCPHCDEGFNIDEDGDAVGRPIVCPHCAKTFYSEESTDVECPHCNGTLSIDPEGDPVGRNVDCPHCSESFYAESSRDIECPHCDETFNLDADGDPTGRDVDCPHCCESFYSEGTGDIECPHCFETFNVDEIDDASPAPAPISPVVQFTNVSVDRNISRDGRAGMLIHVRLSIINMRAVQGLVAAYFALSSGQALKDANGQFTASDGQVSVGTQVLPEWDSTEWKDLQLFMPYDELHLAPQGKHDCQLVVKAFKAATPVGTWELVACSQCVSFSYGAPAPRPDAKVAAPASAQIKRIWVDFDRFHDGVRGTLIHVHFSVANGKGEEGLVAAYFTLADGSNIQGVGETVDLPPNNTEWEDFCLFMPTSELGLPSGGPHFCKLMVNVFRRPAGGGWEVLANSNPHPFTVNADAVAQGSGLLDLTLETDDAGLGSGLLDLTRESDDTGLSDRIAGQAE